MSVLHTNHPAHREPAPLELLELRATHGVLALLEWLHEAEITDAKVCRARLDLTQAHEHGVLAKKLHDLVKDPYRP